MQARYLSMGVMLAMIAFLIPAHAVQLDVAIPKNSEEFVPVYTFTRIVSFQYPEQSKLAELFGESQQIVTFDIDSQNGGMLSDAINSELQERSFVRVTGISGEYSAVITPQAESASVEYKIVLRPTMQGHFVTDSVLDSQWRGFDIEGMVPIETEFGTFDINSPISAFVKMPQVTEYLSESDVVEQLDLRLLDASGLLELPLSKWESIFDPTAKMSESARFAFSGTIVTNYSMGICTVYLGVCQDREHTIPFEIDGEEYLVRFIESQDDGTIEMEGYVQESYIKNTEAFLVTDDVAPISSADDPQVPIIYAMSGMGVAVAAGFFVWSGKKSRKTSSEQTGIDPKDLYATAIGSSAGSYKTNRGTAHLRQSAVKHDAIAKT